MAYAAFVRFGVALVARRPRDMATRAPTNSAENVSRSRAAPDLTTRTVAAGTANATPPGRLSLRWHALKLSVKTARRENTLAKPTAKKQGCPSMERDLLSFSAWVCTHSHQHAPQGGYLLSAGRTAVQSGHLRGRIVGPERFLRGLLVAALCTGMSLASAADAPADGQTRDLLIFNDGDQVQGRFVQTVNGTIMFESDRFGELRVPSSAARVVTAKSPSPALGTPSARVPAPAGSGQDPLKAPASGSMAVLGGLLGPWHGHLAFSIDEVADTTDLHSSTIEGRLQRKWPQDEVVVTSRYVYSRTAGIATTDVVKTEGTWRHDFAPRFFSRYRLLGEWNRAAVYRNLPSDYVLMHNEVGAGVNVVRTPDRNLRLGLSENLLDVWATEPRAGGHSSRLVDGAFVEADWKLPWRMKLNERAVWYYRTVDQMKNIGWENHFDLNKKITEVLSAVLQHEVRNNSPDPRVQDFRQLRLLLGLDF